jgi:hypothetical protein
VVGSRRHLRPSLAVTAAYFTPFDEESDPVNGQATVQAHATFVSLRAVPSIEVLHVPWASLNVGAGGGVDIISVNNPTTITPPPNGERIATNQDIPTRGAPILTALATAYLQLAPSVAFTLVAGSDVDFVPRKYAFSPLHANTNGPIDVINPWPVRPFALAGFTFTALGSELFAARSP